MAGEANAQNPRIAVWSSVTPDYFRAMGIPLLKGRFFAEQDRKGATPVAIVSKMLAHQLMRGGDFWGKRLRVDGMPSPVEVVGEVGDVHQLGMTSELTSEIYLPFSQAPATIICVAIRAAADPLALSRAAQREIWAVDKDQAVSFVIGMERLVKESIAPQRVIAILLASLLGWRCSWRRWEFTA